MLDPSLNKLLCWLKCDSKIMFVHWVLMTFRQTPERQNHSNCFLFHDSWADNQLLVAQRYTVAGHKLKDIQCELSTLFTSQRVF